jgi:hypothetical protein
LGDSELQLRKSKEVINTYKLFLSRRTSNIPPVSYFQISYLHVLTAQKIKLSVHAKRQKRIYSIPTVVQV